MTISKVSVVGLGKLGACMAAAIASKGFEVIGVDVNPKTVDCINQGLAPVLEPGLGEMIAANRERLRATVNCEEAVLDSDLTFLVVPTPSDDNGGFSIRYASEAAREIGHALARKSGYHVVSLTSTVLPGSTEFGILPVLEKEAGKVCGRDFGLCYNPEFIALGSVIRDFLGPDFVLIGESDEKAGSHLEGFLKGILNNNPPFARMSIVNAELTKISVNTYITTKITFANMVADLCEKLPGGDVDVVTAALGMDSRIGKRYLTGALGYGGPCFPRDNLALGYLARTLGVDPLLPSIVDKLNRNRAMALTERVASFLADRATIAVLGLSYKPDTSVVEESHSLYLAQELAARGYKVTVFDPLAMEEARKVLGNQVHYASSLPECLAPADAVVIANPCPEFRRLEPGDFPQKEEPVAVFDCWRILREKLSNASHIRYVPVGIGSQEAPRASRLADAQSGT